jgi:diadenosine hexaphosphate hydrolase (ATP-forming)
MKAPTPAQDPIAGAGGVVFNQAGDVLILQHANGTWVFPKGHIDPGETSLQAAVREVEEEAGVQARCSDPDVMLTTRYVNDRQERRVIYWFPLLTEATTLHLRESLFPDGSFLPPGKARTMLSYEEDKELLDTMLEWWQEHQKRDRSVRPS